MQLKIYSCSKCVRENTEFVKYGKTASGSQRYQCKNCKKTNILYYAYNAYRKNINSKIIQLTKEGLGIRSTARILKISPTTLLARIITIAKNIVKPIIPKGKTYEVDEIRFFIRNKANIIWLVDALNHKRSNQFLCWKKK